MAEEEMPVPSERPPKTYVEVGDILNRTGRMVEDEIELEGLGWVRFRALTRKEMLAADKAAEKKGKTNVGALEARILATALVEPKMTELQVMTWQGNSAVGELQPLVEAVRKLSKIYDDEEEAERETAAEFQE